jgi:hypothetical protein
MGTGSTIRGQSGAKHAVRRLARGTRPRAQPSAMALVVILSLWRVVTFVVRSTASMSMARGLRGVLPAAADTAPVIRPAARQPAEGTVVTVLRKRQNLCAVPATGPSSTRSGVHGQRRAGRLTAFVSWRTATRRVVETVASPTRSRAVNSAVPALVIGATRPGRPGLPPAEAVHGPARRWTVTRAATVAVAIPSCPSRARFAARSLVCGCTERGVSGARLVEWASERALTRTVTLPVEGSVPIPSRKNREMSAAL